MTSGDVDPDFLFPIREANVNPEAYSFWWSLVHEIGERVVELSNGFGWKK